MVRTLYRPWVYAGIAAVLAGGAGWFGRGAVGGHAPVIGWPLAANIYRFIEQEVDGDRILPDLAAGDAAQAWYQAASTKQLSLRGWSYRVVRRAEPMQPGERTLTQTSYAVLGGHDPLVVKLDIRARPVSVMARIADELGCSSDCDP